jgi:hypothetical protein
MTLKSAPVDRHRAPAIGGSGDVGQHHLAADEDERGAAAGGVGQPSGADR